jgi:hypothetical protein
VTLAGGGEEVSRMAFDEAVTLSTAEGTEVRVEGPFDLTIDGASERVDPSSVAPHAASLVAQLRRRVRSVRVLDSGSLEIRIEDDVSLLVHPGQGYESWTYDGSDGSKFVGMPDGDIASWDPPQGSAGLPRISGARGAGARESRTG